MISARFHTTHSTPRTTHPVLRTAYTKDASGAKPRRWYITTRTSEDTQAHDRPTGELGAASGASPRMTDRWWDRHARCVPAPAAYRIGNVDSRWTSAYSVVGRAEAT